MILQTRTDTPNSDKLGNAMVLLAIARSPRLKSMTNFFLANLAVADSSVGIFCVLPNLAQFLSPSWILGQAMCKIYYYVWNVSYTASIVILTVIAIERYIAIIHPFTARNHITHRRLKLVQAVVWVAATAYNIPYLVLFDIVTIPGTGEEFCYFHTESINSLKCLSLANIILWYIVPLCMVVYMYFRVASTLWKTTVENALRLEQCSNASSSRASSTRSLPSHRYQHHPKAHAQTAPLDNIRALHEDGVNGDKGGQEMHEFVTRTASPCSGFCACDKNETQIEPLDDDLCSSHPALHSNGVVCEACLASDQACEKHSDDIQTNVHEECKKSHYKYKRTHPLGSRRVARERRKVVRLLIAVVLSFAICVLPHQLKVLNHYWEFVTLPQSVEVIISPVSFIMLYMNSVMNPFLYALFSSHFRKGFKDSLHCHLVRRPSLKT